MAERSPNRRHLRDTPASDDHVRAASGARASQSPAAQTRTAQAQAAQAGTADGRTRRSAGPGHRRQSEAGGWTYQGSHRSTPGHRFVAGRHAADAPRPGRQYAD